VAVGTNLNGALREIAGALTKYARDHNWSDDDYWIYYRIDPEWDKIHIIFVAKEFDPGRKSDNYVSVRSYLEKHLLDHPEFLNHLGLIVQSLVRVNQGGIYAIGPEFKEFWTFHRR